VRLFCIFALIIVALEFLPHAIAIAAVLGITAAALLLRKDGDDNDQ
jgi:hypothetical protein